MAYTAELEGKWKDDLRRELSKDIAASFGEAIVESVEQVQESEKIVESSAQPLPAADMEKLRNEFAAKLLAGKSPVAKVSETVRVSKEPDAVVESADEDLSASLLKLLA